MRIPVVFALLAQLITSAPKPGHATILSSPPDVSGKAGAKLALFVDVTPKPGIHVYAPGTNDYIPITVKLNAQPAIKAGKITYPKSEIVSIADEKVPVFQRPFRLTQDVTVDRSAKPGSTVVVAGTVSYQACDDKVCFPPESAPVSWTIAVR
jgi:DsbC/DsbD-like thiol-disulfide interchange protein